MKFLLHTCLILFISFHFLLISFFNHLHLFRPGTKTGKRSICLSSVASGGTRRTKKQTRTWRRFTGFTGRQWFLQTRWCGWRRRPHSATLCSRANMGWRRASLHKMLFLSEISHSPCPPPAPMSYSLHPVTPAALAQHQHLIHTTPLHSATYCLIHT